MESRTAAVAVQESPNGVAARLEAELQRTLAAEADELRAERDAEEQVTLAEAVVRERVEWAIAEAREEMSRSAGEPIDTEARLRLVEARSEIAASRNGARNGVGDLAERLLDRLVAHLDRDRDRPETADQLGARIDSWLDELRARTDAAEKRLDEAGIRARGEIEGYVTASLSRKARRHELRLAREEREHRIAEAEARVESRGEEMLRQVRVDVDRVRAEAQASMRTELAAALERLNELFESETEVLRIGMEGELERMLRAARSRLTSPF